MRRLSANRSRWLHRVRAAAVALLSLLSFTSPADAAATGAPTVQPSAAKYAKGLLWRIESPTGLKSFLFGTIHSDDPRVINLPPAVAQSLDASDRFVMEAVMDGKALVKMSEVMYFNDGRTLEQVIGVKLHRDTVKAVAARGIPAHAIERQKPWPVMMILSVPPPRSGDYLDLVLQSRAAGQKKPVIGLETISEQLAVFDELTLADQTALLADVVYGQDDVGRDLEALHRAYLARDLNEIANISERHLPTGNARIYRNVMDRLLTQRNQRMLDRLAPILRQGGAFIAVGAAHLSGDSGLLRQLERAGYRVTAVY